MITEGLTEAMVRFAARHEYVLKVDDDLARRTRWMFLDAALASKLAPAVDEIHAKELHHDPVLDAVMALADRYAFCPQKFQ